MKKNIVFIIISLSLASVLFSQHSTTRQIVKINLTNLTQETLTNFTKLGLDITLVDRHNNSVNALVNQTDLQKIVSLGLKTETLLDDADAFACQLRQSGYLDYFHNYEQMLLEMNEIVASHPELARLEDIGDSYEKTIGRGGYDIYALKISDNVNIDEVEPEVFYMANMHAREIITPEIILYFMHYLIDNYDTNGYVTHLVNNREIWLCPSMNPDGHEYVFSGTTCQNDNDPMLWRKNKRDNNENGIFDTYYDGVDLNRNFGYKWGYDDSGSRPEPNSETYRGTSAFSEPESQAIRNFVNSHHFIISLSFHSYIQLWLYPWGYINQHTPDHAIFVALADSCVAYNHYHPETGYGLYAVNGDTDDWFYGEQTEKNKIFAFTPEVGSSGEAVGGCWGFYPDTSFIDKQISENQGPMLYLAYAAGEEPLFKHTPLSDTEAQGPFQILVKIVSPIILTEASPLDESSLKIFYNTTGFAPFESTALSATGNPNEYSGDIPSLINDGDIYYYITATDQISRTGTAPRGAPLASYSFHVGADTEAPVILHIPVTDGSVSSTAFIIRAHVIDNFGLNTVKLFYRKNENPLDSLNMTSLSSVKDDYAGIITVENAVPGDYYEYKIVAEDISENHNKTYEPDSGFYRINIRNSLLYDFELASTFIAQAGGDWQWGTPTSGPENAHSGVQLWATNLSGNYSDLTESILETPKISLLNKDSSAFVFWHWYSNEYSQNTYWDGGNVKISVDGGPFQIIVPVDGYDGIVDSYNTFLGDEPCFGGPAGTGNFWHQEIFDLTSYTDHSVKFRFHFASDAYTTDLGWYIDDVEIIFKDKTTVKLDDRLTNVTPGQYELFQNYPNPFNPKTEIKYRLADAGEVTIEILNTIGQKVKTLEKQYKIAGNHSIFWNGDDENNKPVASGLYFYQLKIVTAKYNKIFTKKMVKLE